MIEKVLKIFNRPFPIIETNREKFIFSASLGVFIFLFLSVFEPFGLNRLTENKYRFFLGYGLITFVVELLFTFGLMKIFRKFYSPQNWTLGKHLINVFFFITSLAFFNWLFTVWIDYPNYNLFTPFLVDTLALGFFPMIFVFLYLERKLRFKNVKLSEKINRVIEKKEEVDKTVEKTSSVFSVNDLKINMDDLLYVKSLGNYVSVCFTVNGENKKEIIRTTMKKIENNLAINDDIVRCHKSYFVNLKKVTNSFGNARSLYLQIGDAEVQIPVSRKMAKELISKI